MYLIVGLGNPGKKYGKTRHNAGFRTLDALQKERGFHAWRAKKVCASMLSDGTVAGEKTMLCKPQTFMNGSGSAVRRLMKTLGMGADNLIVVHDDIDLPLGKIKIVRNRGSAGHLGISSIISALGTKDFIRLRIGVKPSDGKETAAELVLENFSRPEEATLKEAIRKSLRAVELIAQKEPAKAMTEYNK
ncbi:MAG: aminoacyl-tRNA hydrolase [Candidatus Wildermuthbacteria bacterium RIFCSPHIGHO2_01_FULL_47_27]|uniref:Peptidyl-tRNA hydrolase n=2 Tax=Candidatus Wildermuthiibacteriota TaxID=1817923 RepID=A0A1G2RSJ7_9BACT|nr:MAG: Peptidyl-tRNA hydrolase [Parcubacteria group bacterium GW2011_GWA2_47_9]OHA65004.1 MAG: aminoacyl-tRNA hydrolase [Candidatus Wildermuthbacteria bacterium RIFCSPHIGHO2_01_FULL_47_27]OHA67000.1 MAG: aminoacyl-tRNA hydrolase [Candidatus Wildermuthbacteria bacterium RIFCSPHIGHO2_02_FULL_47_17]OHA75438.1 MAG: aminoacyl-tRNA hydrolase [Candidatus Wildermuthbacteria bacterium RIFCSPLOWO2_01_FULL_48_35]